MLVYPRIILLETKYESSFKNARPHLIHELEDVYCELGDFLYIEYLLKDEIKRLDNRERKNFMDRYLLRLSRTELL